MLQRVGTEPSTFNPQPSPAPPVIHEVLRTPGRPLDPDSRTFFDPGFGHDFSQVGVQTKLAINQPQDEYERTADRVANHVMRTPDPGLRQTNPIVSKSENEADPRAPAREGVGSNFLGAGAMMKLPRLGFVHPVAASLAEPGVQFRLPEFGRVKAAYTDPGLKIPEKVIKERVAELLGRMKRESRLKTTDPVATIIAKIFPSPGKIDEAEFNKVIDVSDRSQIYKSVTDADTKVLTADKPKLQTAMVESANLVKKVEGDAAGLTAVFGSKSSVAKANYVKARAALGKVAKDIDKHVTTDYNLDDPEVGLGGWASFSSQTMHLLLDIAKVTDPKETKATLIHEASHFANPSVDDQVYYGAAGFFELDEAKKVANAAHYEELPRREMGTSKFAAKTFTPGVAVGGGAVTREDKVKAATNLYLRKAWDAGVDAHTFIRGVRREHQAGNNVPFSTHKVLILEISKLMNLTVHEQAPAKAIVTVLDVTLTESISRGVTLVGRLAGTIPFPSPVGVLTDDQLRDKIVAAAVVKYGNLLNDATRDKALLDWLVAHYRLLPSV